MNYIRGEEESLEKIWTSEVWGEGEKLKEEALVWD